MGVGAHMESSFFSLLCILLSMGGSFEQSKNTISVAEQPSCRIHISSFVVHPTTT